MSPSSKYRRKLKAGQAPPEPVARRVWTIQPVDTIWVGLSMLVLGALCGLAIQPLFAAASRPSSTPVNSSVSQSGTESVRPTPTQDNSPRGQMMRGVINQTRHFLGDENAAVTIVEFCDFEVSACGQFASEVQAQLTQAYIDTGKVRFGFWPMATLGEGSQLAAEAAECAAEQDAFWPFYEAVFTDWVEGTRSFDRVSLAAYAAEMGLDTTAFGECLASGRYTELIAQGTTTAQGLGLKDTPAFLVNGQPLIGFQSLASLQQVIDAILVGQ